ncbi:chemosensory receptor A [Elysia marginata]|uniref:Chemosensory receptor A n=1 Tax=Elysia marginata TaxID=1093978 RepID=A0AAV4FCD4_9GAST|nr:chemosensory receptor A [Elysia marginata]
MWSVLVYDSECWTISKENGETFAVRQNLIAKKMEKRLLSIEMWFLRRILMDREENKRTSLAPGRDAGMNTPLDFSVNREHTVRILDVLNRGIVIYVTYVTMVTSMCILIAKLYQAAKIRRSCTTGQTLQPSDKPSEKPTDPGLNTKDIQVIKSVVVVCIIFILSQLPSLMTSTIRLFIPDFDMGKRLRFMFGIFGQINVTCSYLNASVNIFVYYNFNSKFRSVLRSHLPCQNMQ